MAATRQQLELIVTHGFADYALIDSGGGRKLERFGAVTVDRPEAQALWQPRLGPAAWRKANAVFAASGEDDEKGRWRVDKPVPESWPVRLCAGREPASVTMLCRLSAMWHLGLFPEQLPHWDWMRSTIGAVTGEAPRVLNLFGYTGAASLLAAAAGAQVTHVDASKKAVQWGKENQSASGLGNAQIRWIVDDARKFAAREVRRGRTYHMILVDPPKFGRGPEGEVWDLFKDLPALIEDCSRLLAPASSAMVLTVYAIRASALAFEQLMREKLVDRAGQFAVGELAIAETGGRFMVPTSLYTRWTSDGG